MRTTIGTGKRLYDAIEQAPLSQDLARTVAAYKDGGGIQAGAADKDLASLVKRLGVKGSVGDIHAVQLVATEALDRLADSPLDRHPGLTDVLLECSYYFDRIGDVDRALALAKAGLAGATCLPESNSARRAHSVVGAMYIRVFDFAKACEHLERARELAQNSGNRLYILGAMANTVAALQTMGFNYEAQRVALDILRQPAGSEDLDLLHLLNANNGIMISHALGDLRSAEAFLRVAVKKSKAASRISTEVTKAYFEASRAAQLTATGRHDRALKLINKAITRMAADCTVRVHAILYCAQAEAHLAKGEISLIAASQVKLTALLDHSDHLASHYEAVLQTLIRLHSTIGDADLRHSVAELRVKLSKHLVTVKHKSLYRTAAAQLTARSATVGLLAPSYTIPRWIAQCQGNGLSVPARFCRTVGEDGVVSAREEPQESCEETAISQQWAEPSGDYQAAERWALATELFAEGRWDHCLTVGSLAGAIARSSGRSVTESKEIELACRLHDVGKIRLAMGLNTEQSLRSRGKYRILHEHTTLGGAILTRSLDPVTRLGAEIAFGHHEWWNGAGYPAGLKGNSIPVAARICAVADAFVALLEPTPSTRPWPIEDAKRQIQCMAGVQLDPSFVSVLLAMEGIHALLRTSDEELRKFQALVQLRCVGPRNFPRAAILH